MNYRAHYYGPYSAEVNSSLNECVSLGFVEERTSGFGVADEADYEVRRYDYILTEEGKEVVDDLKERYKDSFNGICKTLKILEKSGKSQDYQDLSIAAKTMHIVCEHGGQLDSYSVVKEAKKLGWKVSKGQIEKAMGTVESFKELMKGKIKGKSTARR